MRKILNRKELREEFDGDGPQLEIARTGNEGFDFTDTDAYWAAMDAVRDAADAFIDSLGDDMPMDSQAIIKMADDNMGLHGIDTRAVVREKLFERRDELRVQSQP
jgi:hypothetical protein